MLFRSVSQSRYKQAKKHLGGVFNRERDEILAQIIASVIDPFPLEWFEGIVTRAQAGSPADKAATCRIEGSSVEQLVDYLCGFLLFVLVYLTAVGFAIEHLMLGLEAVVLFVGW